jgi:hypothetical protein
VQTVRVSATDSFERFGSVCALAAGVVGFLYALAFVVVSRSAPALGAFLSALALLVFGLLATAVYTAIYRTLQQSSPGFALWALLLGGAAGLGAAIHGGYDLSNALHPPASPNLDLPSPIDPRGLLTFGVGGLAVLLVSSLMSERAGWPAGLRYLGCASAALLIVLYLARLIVLDATSLIILVPALLNGFLLQPAWLIWMGVCLNRTR